MRRMNYNPFETPFASGEFSKSRGEFVLDEKLKNGFYVFQVISSDADHTSGIIYLNDYSSSSAAFFGGYSPFTITATANSNIIGFNDFNGDPFLEDGATIIFYKII